MIGLRKLRIHGITKRAPPKSAASSRSLEPASKRDRLHRYTGDMPVPYRFAICNELFEKRPFAEVCRKLHALGYEGIELAPFTLGEDPAALTQAGRVEIGTQIADAGLSFVGLHWLLTAPPGLHVTARDEKQRRHTWDYVGRLIDLCAELARASNSQNPVVVFGSPKQRSSNGGLSAQECVDIFRDELARAAPRAEASGVALLLEALS